MIQFHICLLSICMPIFYNLSDLKNHCAPGKNWKNKKRCINDEYRNTVKLPDLHFLGQIIFWCKILRFPGVSFHFIRFGRPCIAVLRNCRRLDFQTVNCICYLLFQRQSRVWYLWCQSLRQIPQKACDP